MNTSKSKKVKPNKFDPAEMLATLIRAEGAFTEAPEAVSSLLLWADKFCNEAPIDLMEGDYVPGTCSLWGRPDPKRGIREIKRLSLLVTSSWKAFSSGVNNWDKVLRELNAETSTSATGKDSDNLETLSRWGFAPQPFKSLGAYPAADAVKAAAQSSRELYDYGVGLVNCLSDSGIADITIFKQYGGDPKRFSREVNERLRILRHEFTDLERQLLQMQTSLGGKEGKDIQEANKLANKRKRVSNRIQRNKPFYDALAAYRESNPDTTLPDAAWHLQKCKVSPSFEAAKSSLRRGVNDRLITAFPESTVGRPLGGQKDERHR